MWLQKQEWWKQMYFCLSFINKLQNVKCACSKGLASYCKAGTTFTFHFSILTLSNASLGIDNREMKSESGFSFAIASQPFETANIAQWQKLRKID